MNKSNRKLSDIEACLEAGGNLAAEYRKALSVIEAIDERRVDGCDAYEDWKFMGELARDYLLHHTVGFCSPSFKIWWDDPNNGCPALVLDTDEEFARAVWTAALGQQSRTNCSLRAVLRDVIQKFRDEADYLLLDKSSRALGGAIAYGDMASELEKLLSTKI